MLPSKKICVVNFFPVLAKPFVGRAEGGFASRNFRRRKLWIQCEKTLAYALICVQKGYVRIDRALFNMRQRVPMKYLSTREVASIVGIGRATLERWLTSGALRQPRAVQVGQGKFRQWTDADVERTRKFKGRNYRKGRGRKKSATAQTERAK